MYIIKGGQPRLIRDFLSAQLLVIKSLERSVNANEAPFLHEVRLFLQDTNPLFCPLSSCGEIVLAEQTHYLGIVAYWVKAL